MLIFEAAYELKQQHHFRALSAFLWVLSQVRDPRSHCRPLRCLPVCNIDADVPKQREIRTPSKLLLSFFLLSSTRYPPNACVRKAVYAEEILPLSGCRCLFKRVSYLCMCAPLPTTILARKHISTVSKRSPSVFFFF